MAARVATCALALALVAPLGGCFAYGHGTRDIDRTPIVNTGAGATILYPGQAPPMPGQTYPNSSPEAGAPGTGTGTASHAPASTGPITMIGGAQQEELRHEAFREEPIWYKYLALPFAVAAAPFKKIAEALHDEPEPGPAIPRANSAPKRPSSKEPPPNYESTRLLSIERELDQRKAQEAAAQRAASAGGPHSEAARAPAPSLSIADELAAMRRESEAPQTTRQPATAPQPEASRPRATPRSSREPNPVTAHGIVDRDGDGRTDHWIYRDNGEIVREAFDENSDGAPDRTVRYDHETHRVTRIEEDADHDGQADSWTDYRDGKVARRRVDADGDGLADTWSFYSEGQITRHERDTTADGFRDRVGFYREGQLEREELDRDADGLTDVIIHYDENERMARKEEDRNGDGVIDLISHYESGRLARRELLDPSVLGGGR